MAKEGLVPQRARPTLLEFSTREHCRAISAGKSHSLALTAAQQLYAFGANSAGQLGTGDTARRRKPTLIAGVAQLAQVSAGEEHSAAMDDAGAVWLWGSNRHGKLGLDLAQESRLSPHRSESLPIATKMVACGAEDTLLLTNEGRVLVAGKSATRPGFSFVEGVESVERVLCSNFMAVLTAEGSLFVWGDSPLATPAPRLAIGFERGVVDVALGRDFLILLDRNLLVHSQGRPGAENRLSCARELSSQPIKNVFCGDGFALCLVGARPAPVAEEGAPLDTLREFQRSMYDLLNDIHAKVPDIHENVDPAILDRLLRSERRLNAQLSPARERREARVEELLAQFRREFPGEETERVCAAQLAEMRRLLRFGNSNLLFLLQRAEVVGERISACAQSIDRKLSATRVDGAVRSANRR